MTVDGVGAVVVSVNADGEHRFSKPSRETITLLRGLGVEGDAHLGRTVQHRSRVAVDPTQPNLRQMHLIHAELFDEVADAGHTVEPGDMGENITTAGIRLIELPTGTVLRIGSDAVVELTGLRNPCAQINGFEPGLLREMVGRDAIGAIVRKAGVMAIVLATGEVTPGDRIVVELPAGQHEALEPV